MLQNADLWQNEPPAHRSTVAMVHTHNCLLRGLNSILQQGPYIADASQAHYTADDVRDLMLYMEVRLEFWVTLGYFIEHPRRDKD